MAASTLSIEISGLARTQLSTLRAQAKALGMSAETYARQLLEEGISLEHRARTTTFDELFAAVQKRFQKSGMSEEELDQLVDAARARHHRRNARKKH